MRRRMGIRTIQRRLDQAWSRYEKEVYKIAERVAKETVHPLCKERAWEFTTGMGSWSISPTKESPDPISSVFQGQLEQKYPRLVEILECEVEGFTSNDLGSLMPDLTERKRR